MAMSSAVEKAVEALELLPEEMLEQAADYLLSQAQKYRALKEAIDEGMADVGRGASFLGIWKNSWRWLARKRSGRDCIEGRCLSVRPIGHSLHSFLSRGT